LVESVTFPEIEPFCAKRNEKIMMDVLMNILMGSS